MKKILTAIIYLSFFLSFFQSVDSARAQIFPGLSRSCKDEWLVDFTGSPPPTEILVGSGGSLSFTLQSTVPGGISPGNYSLIVYESTNNQATGGFSSNAIQSQVSNGTLTFNVSSTQMPLVFDQEREFKWFYLENPAGNTCVLWGFRVINRPICQIQISQKGRSNNDLGCIDNTADLEVTMTAQYADGTPYTGRLALFGSPFSAGFGLDARSIPFSNGSATEVISAGDLLTGRSNAGTIKLSSLEKTYFNNLAQQTICETRSITVQGNACSEEQVATPPTSVTGGPFELCNQIPATSPYRSDCQRCLSQNAVWTAIGCIETTATGIISRFISLGIGLGGGIALLTMIASGFILTTSQGDPQRANQAKEMMTASVVGLLFIIFSVVILQFIGVTIFRIPGFGGE